MTPDQETSSPALPRSTAWVPALLIAAITVVAFLPALFNGFVDWDDNLLIFENRYLHDLSWESLRWAFSTFLLGHYHPVTWLSFMADRAIWGMGPFGFHLTNLLLHAANAVLFYFLTLRLLPPTRSRFPAFAAALFFAVHPLRVESVAWATERRDVLSGFFLLLAVIFYLRKHAAEVSGRPGTRDYALSLGAYALSLLSKSIGATLPVVLLILDIYPLGRLSGGADRARTRVRVLLEKVPYLGLGFLLGIVALVAEGREGAARSFAAHSVVDRLAQAAYGLCFYVTKTTAPVSLSPLYLLEEGLVPTRPIYLLSAAAAIALTIVLLALRRRWPAGIAAWASYVVLVAPMLGLYQVGMQKVADRYSYLPCLAFAVLIGAGLRMLEKHRFDSMRTATWSVSAIVLAILGVLTFRQCRVWESSIALWNQAVRVEPENHVAHDHRGQALNEAGDLRMALVDFNRAIDLRPGLADYHVNRGITLLELGETDAAIADFDRSIDLRPDSPLGYLNRATARLRQRDLEAAFRDANSALEANPHVAEAHNVIGLVFESRGDRQAAVDAFGAGIDANPLYFEVRFNRGRVLADVGRFDVALIDFDRALELLPSSIPCLLERAGARAALGDVPGAMDDYAAALRLDPQHADAYNNRGNLRLRRGDLDGAVADFTAAISNDPRHAYAWLNRCVVAQMQRRFKDAVDDCGNALAIAPTLVEAYLARSEARRSLGDDAGARADLDEALLLVPEGPARAEIERMKAR